MMRDIIMSPEMLIQPARQDERPSGVDPP